MNRGERGVRSLKQSKNSKVFTAASAACAAVINHLQLAAVHTIKKAPRKVL
jgi:hypothetical protein